MTRNEFVHRVVLAETSKGIHEGTLLKNLLDNVTALADAVHARVPFDAGTGLSGEVVPPGHARATDLLANIAERLDGNLGTARFSDDQVLVQYPGGGTLLTLGDCRQALTAKRAWGRNK